jgi:uroporphyrinogen decarboxylase
VGARRNQMTSREKVLRAISRQGPAPFPKHLRPCPELAEQLRRMMGTEDLESSLGLDMRWVYCGRPKEFEYDQELSERDFGAAFDFEQVARQAEAARAAGLAAVSGYEQGTFEQAHDIRGMDELFVSLVTDPKEARPFLARIARNKARIAAAYARAGVDVVFIGDDMGSQRALLMSEEMWHDFFRPPLETIIAEARAAVPGTRIAYHSCGHVEPLVPGLVEAGIDVLESVQPECNDVPHIVHSCGDRLAFWGAVGAQSTMPRGTPGQVRDAVLALTALFPQASGLIVAPAHTLEVDTPPENVLAFIDAVGEADQRVGKAFPARS